MNVLRGQAALLERGEGRSQETAPIEVRLLAGGGLPPPEKVFNASPSAFGKNSTLFNEFFINIIAPINHNQMSIGGNEYNNPQKEAFESLIRHYQNLKEKLCPDAPPLTIIYAHGSPRDSDHHIFPYTGIKRDIPTDEVLEEIKQTYFLNVEYEPPLLLASCNSSKKTQMNHKEAQLFLRTDFICISAEEK